MLSSFILGSAQYVKTDYWIKLDADGMATNDNPLYEESFKNYAFVSHRWGYSRPDMIRKLDEWASKHWKRKLHNAKPMINEGKIEGNRFYHKGKRNISYVQFHKTKFIKFCVSLLKTKRLPVPSHDTFTYFVCNRFDPQLMCLKNFKRHYGFTQLRGRLGPDHIRQKVEETELKMAKEKETKKLVEKPIEKPIDTPVEKLIEKPVNNPINNPVPKPLELTPYSDLVINSVPIVEEPEPCAEEDSSDM